MKDELYVRIIKANDRTRFKVPSDQNNRWRLPFKVSTDRRQEFLVFPYLTDRPIYIFLRGWTLAATPHFHVRHMLFGVVIMLILIFNKIITKNANHNKLWSLISTKPSVEECNLKKLKKEENKRGKTLLLGTEWMKWNRNISAKIWLRNSERIEI